jgi:DNA-binding HxlR family transcriptional regulator
VTNREPRWNPYSANCPTRVVLDRVADKWAVLVLGLLVDGPVRFNRLRRVIEGVSQKMLTQTLRNLEADGLVTRTVFPTVPVTVEYALTPLGRSLAGVLEGVRRWSEENVEAILKARERNRARPSAQGGQLHANEAGEEDLQVRR